MIEDDSEDDLKEAPLQAAPRPEPLPPPREGPEGPEGIEKLFIAHNRLVFQAAYRITGNAGDAEDVLQTVFLRLLRRQGGPPLSGNLAGYLRTAGVNAALDLLRRRAASRTGPLTGAENHLPAPAGDGPEHRQQDSDTRDRLRRALARLGPRSAEAFVLRYFEGHDNREIARIVNSSPTAVAVLLHRARARISEEFGGSS
jgi:RNA polymerase sigma-70 factor (ECF subfamily)